MHDQLVGSVSCDPIVVNYTMPADDHKELFGNILPGQMCPVINETTDWERRVSLGGDRYVYYGDIDSRSGSSKYDDPRDYHEWCDWSDMEDDKGYFDPFRSDVEEGIVTSGCASRIVTDDAVVAAVMCSAEGVTISFVKLNLVHNIINGKAPNYLSESINLTCNQHSINTRSSTLSLQVPYVKSVGKTLFQYTGIQAWLNCDVQGATSQSSFKYIVKQFLFNYLNNQEINYFIYY